jgi:hypothetical protein
MKAVIALLLLCAPAYAQVPVRDAAQALAPPSGSARISGVIVGLKDEPIRRASVIIAGDMGLERRTITSNDGRFDFTGLPSGRFTVSAEKPGYPRMSYGAKRAFRNGAGVFLDEGEHVADISLTLAAGVVLTGIVRDEHGQPLPGVPVMAWLIRQALGGGRTLDYAASGPDTVFTDDRGRYRTYGLPPGEYTVGTSWYYSGQGFDVHLPPRPGAKTEGPPPRYNYAPVYAPGVSDPLSAATYTLAPGEVREGVDLQMRFDVTSRIEGSVANPAGGVVPPSRLSIMRRSPVMALNTTQVSGTGADGRFATSSLSPGLYSVQVETQPTTESPALWARADVELSSGEPTVVALTLAPALTLTGKLVFEGTTLKPPAQMPRVSVFMFGIRPTHAETQTTVDASGAVTITGVVPGRYMVRSGVPAAAMATPPPAGTPTWTVQSVMMGDQDVTDRAFDISAGGGGALTVTFTDRVSELTGTLTRPDGTPETDYFVVVMPADREMWLPLSRRLASTRPDRTGKYTFRALPPGDYLIAVTTDLLSQDLQDTATISALAEQAIAVTIKAGERRTLDVRTTGG